MASRKILGGVAFAALSLTAGGAHAQSTASQIAEGEIVVSGRRNIDGAISAEHGTKARSTVTQDFIEHQVPGQTILEQINLVPGVSFSNNDAYGTSGGELNIRGFDGARISLTFDGIQLNDTGNYAIYSNQQLDPELISRANVNLGSTDVDSPTASATGGTVNYVTALPEDTFGLQVRPSIGSDNYFRTFVRIDSGEFGPWGTSMFGAISGQMYEQFVGPGELQKVQYNFRVYQPLAGDDFLSLSVHYNENRNDFYRRVTLAQFNAGTAESVVYDPTCTYTTNQCQNYYGLNINPSNTGNIRGQSRFSLADNLTLTIDPSFQYTLADGGSTFNFSEVDARLLGTGGASSLSTNSGCAVITGPLGVDLNGDCDTSDTSVRLFQPNITNTRRWMATSSLIWDIMEGQQVRFGVTWDRGEHRQTGEITTIGADGEPNSPFGGKEGWGATIPTLDGGILRRRDRSSIAILEQASVEYRGEFFDDALSVVVGARAPHFTRELHNRCFTEPGNANPWCTTNLATVPANYTIAPFQATVEYDDVLPNAGLTWHFGDTQQIFFNYAENISAPRTDDLYIVPVGALSTIQPETSQSYDLGYRYQSSSLLLAATAWFSAFENRIERTYDQDTGNSFSTNVGGVDLWGFDFEAGWTPSEHWSFIFSASWKDSEIQSDIPTGAATFVDTSGNELYNTPELTTGFRVQYENGPFLAGFQGRYVGERWSNLTNTEIAPDYEVFDFDMRFDFGQSWHNENAYLQFNITNVFNEDYLGAISTDISGTRQFNLGAPRTAMMTLGLEF